MICHSEVRSTTNRGSLRRRATAVALAAAFGLAASAPMAAIIDSGPIAYGVPQTTLGVYINLVTGSHGTAAQAPGWDFNPFGSAFIGFFASTVAGNTTAVVSNGAGIATALAVGNSIGPANAYQTNGTAQTTGTAFRTTGIEFVGLAFMNEATGVTNYGYAQIQTTGTAGTGFPATVLRYVYENTGLPITITPPSPTILYAFNKANNHLVRFDASTPGTLISDIPLTGLAPTDTVLGIDFRPATGQLYAMVNNGSVQRVVRIATTTGAVHSVDALISTGSPTGTAFGIDFNPTVDRLREVSNAEENLRFNPVTGALAATDTSLAYVAGDPFAGVNPNVVHVAYTNNFFGATTTTLYGIDSITDSLVMIGGPNGVPSPNTGQLTTIGSLGVAFGPLGGFDIHYGTNVAYAALASGPGSLLFTINLATGAATLVGQIGTLTQVDGLSVAFDMPAVQSVQSRKFQGAANFDLGL